MKALLIERIYETTVWPLAKFREKEIQWNNIGISELLHYPEESLGFHLGCFLILNNFELQPKFESGDVIHVLTGIGTSVPEEIGLHYYLLGNGKINLWSVLFILTGTFFYFIHFKSFLTHYQKGKNAALFHNLEFVKILHQPLDKIREAFKIQ